MKRMKFMKFPVIVLGIFIIALTSASLSASASEHIMGDVDKNGICDSFDALMIQRYSVGLMDFDDSQILIADVNQDGNVDSYDSLLVLRYSVGLENLGAVILPDDNADITDQIPANNLNDPEPFNELPNYQNNEDSGKKEAPAANATDAAVSDYEKKVVELVNAERAKAGLPPLAIDTDLCKLSDQRVGEIKKHFSHEIPDGSDWYVLLKTYNVKYFTAGENIAAGQITPEMVVEDWMSSEGHRANILNPDFTKIGVGYSYAQGDLFGHYWQQVFTG